MRIKPVDKESYWVPVEWLHSTDGLPVRRDPDVYAPRIPSATLRTWQNWLMDVRSLAELEKFERRRTSQDLQFVVDSLVFEQMALLRQRFEEWGTQRNWLPLADNEPQAASPSAPRAATASPAGDGNANIPADERSAWLPAEVCIFGRWIAGFWRHIATGEWRSPHGTKPLIAPNEWKLI